LDFVNLGGQIDRYPDETKALVARNADIIIASGTELALTSAVAATGSLPIVMIAVDYDPIALGHVTNLARPESNVTGLLFQQVELAVKRIEIFKFAFPNLSSAAVLWDRISAEQWQAVQRAGPSLGVRFAGLELGEPPHDFDRLLAQVPAEYRGALFVLMTPVLYQSRARLFESAIRHGIPTVAGLRVYAEANAFMSYGPSIDALYRRAAEYVDRIYKGAKPADLPIEQPT
jgi:putative ABC transport system substrate-binding protein